MLLSEKNQEHKVYFRSTVKKFRSTVKKLIVHPSQKEVALVSKLASDRLLQHRKVL